MSAGGITPGEGAPKGYSIAAVSKLTGVSCHSLRIWERRYGFLNPLRSPSGHRRYSCEQVRMLKALVEEVRGGKSISESIELLRTQGFTQREPSEDVRGGRDELLGRSPQLLLIDLLAAGETRAAETLYRQYASELDVVDLVRAVVGPALVESGERWFLGEFSVFEEHIVTHFFHRELHLLIARAEARNEHPSRRILIGSVQGDRHGGGVLIASLMLELGGWRVISLGVELPVCEFQEAVAKWRPDALGVSFILSRSINKRFQELSSIKNVPVFVGGRSILNYQGLARRYGLIPVSGPIEGIVDEIEKGYQSWQKANT